MAIDSFTGEIGMLLISNDPTVSTLEALVNLLKGMGDSAPVPEEVVQFIESNIGKPVKVVGTCYKAVIHSCNKAQGGFYPGIRYPVYVRITETDDERKAYVIGKIFEYGLDQIKLL